MSARRRTEVPLQSCQNPRAVGSVRRGPRTSASSVEPGVITPSLLGNHCPVPVCVCWAGDSGVPRMTQGSKGMHIYLVLRSAKQHAILFFFFFLTFWFEIILDFQKNGKNRTEFPDIFAQLPLVLTNILHKNRKIIKVKKFASVRCTINYPGELLWASPVRPLLLSFCSRIHLGSHPGHFLSPLRQLLSLSWSFETLTFFEEHQSVVLQNIPHGLCPMFLVVRWRSRTFGK